jgi:MOSC domain-containing protein YiiM
MSTGFTILSINISEKRGVHKHPVSSALLVENYGVEGDAHAGDWPRQVSLLAAEEVKRAQRLEQTRGASFDYYTENFTTRGVDLAELPVGTQLHLGEAVLEITRIGKKPEEAAHYSPSKNPREYVNSRRGVFARVLKGGTVTPQTRCWV